ncbi:MULTISPECIES: type II toxin-antitoxin system RelE/ParE family toxin [Providencia]|uniref:Type II toxin-antitoxin system RelE/ParE family toxin n=1 Tax=Providencia huaxiensis TaxID=2027290 RepID=A0A8I2D626_9GAMM|nr:MULTISPECIES: type II toxin-antitoxin system RelE/ParE family toxin [Providencia]MBQ0268220.1 type II toxin-antitoxin system RelE/ParE family toxin [Providencia huaxiensis]MBQ0532882.1 type II toxin-antitoxin system RelE/ParE family toxin [Providencia huaxiensis]MBQ0587348.1 type II toxin-antitoxin system RelE/ParE family toxin [Providencia huaxiensis]MCG9533879.1 type II toxin-antitoxin system RelE/ParE family toxin [Providencia huaxiensis]MDI7239008.1 type II toxin-antitoxin system RelE/P
MEQPYTVTLAETALWSLQDVESFKINFMSSVQAAAFVDELLLSSVRAISEDPKRYRPNQMLADNGLLIRERIDAISQYRCLYEFDMQTNNVVILLFISTAQDLEKTLYRYYILR